MLSNPWLESSLGSIADTSISTFEQIANGVLVLGAIQAPERIRASRVGTGGSGEIEGRLKTRDQRVVGCLGRAWTPRWRHRARAKLLDDDLPGFGVGSDVLEIDRAQYQVALFGLLVMTAGTVPIQGLPLR